MRACKGKTIRLSSSLIISSFTLCQNHSILFFSFFSTNLLSFHCVPEIFLDLIVSFSPFCILTWPLIHTHSQGLSSNIKSQEGRRESILLSVASVATLSPPQRQTLRIWAPVTGCRITGWAAVDPASRGVLSSVGTGPPLSLWRLWSWLLWTSAQLKMPGVAGSLPTVSPVLDKFPDRAAPLAPLKWSRGTTLPLT